MASLSQGNASSRGPIQSPQGEAGADATDSYAMVRRFTGLRVGV